MSKNFRVHVTGPDDIYPPATEIDALREANGINQVSVECNNGKSHKEYIVCTAVVYPASHEIFDHLRKNEDG